MSETRRIKPRHAAHQNERPPEQATSATAHTLFRISCECSLHCGARRFRSLWGEFDQADRAQVLSSVLHAVIVDGASGNAELRFRGAR